VIRHPIHRGRTRRPRHFLSPGNNDNNNGASISRSVTNSNRLPRLRFDSAVCGRATRAFIERFSVFHSTSVRKKCRLPFTITKYVNEYGTFATLKHTETSKSVISNRRFFSIREQVPAPPAGATMVFYVVFRAVFVANTSKSPPTFHICALYVPLSFHRTFVVHFFAAQK